MMRDVLVIDRKERENFWTGLKSSHKILFATSAYEGLGMLSEEVGLVFLDLQLLDSNGMEVLRLIKKAYPSIEVIIITSCMTEEPCMEAFRKGVIDYIRKPLDSEEILQKIQMLISAGDVSQKQQIPSSGQNAKAGSYAGIPSHLLNGVLKVRDFIVQNYSESLSLEAACKMASTSKTYFCRFFKLITGYSLRTYHHVVKIQVADELLRDQRFSIQDIAQQLGYRDSNYFSTIYKKITGNSPRHRQSFARPLEKSKEGLERI